MEGTALFETVLDPGERLLWSGHPRKQAFALAGLNFAILTAGLGYVFGKLHRSQAAPLPTGLAVELILVACMLVAAGYLLGTRIFRAWKTAYAVTDRRLLAALAPDRHQIRSMLLADLDEVKSEYRPKMGKVLLFRRRDGSRPVIWAVRDVEQVRKLIESARTQAGSQAA